MINQIPLNAIQNKIISYVFQIELIPRNQKANNDGNL